VLYVFTIKTTINRLVAHVILCCCIMQGLITKDRKVLDPAVARFARGHGPDDVEDLLEGG
jgi:hypothetical protein